jgi:hypothetical protein
LGSAAISFIQNAIAMRLFGLMQVIGLLHRQPESGAGTKCPADAQCRFRRNGALAGDDLLDTLRWNPELQRKRIGAETPSLQLFLENAAWMGGVECHGFHHVLHSMIIDDLDVISVAVLKTEDQAPGTVDRHCPIPVTIATQFVEADRRKRRDFVQHGYRVEELQPGKSLCCVEA